MCPLGGEIAHYLWATFHLHSWLLWEPLWLWWKSHKPLLGTSTALTADTLMDSFVIGKEGNDSELAVALFDGEVHPRLDKWSKVSFLCEINSSDYLSAEHGQLSCPTVTFLHGVFSCSPLMGDLAFTLCGSISATQRTWKLLKNTFLWGNSSIWIDW